MHRLHQPLAIQRLELVGGDGPAGHIIDRHRTHRHVGCADRVARHQGSAGHHHLGRLLVGHLQAGPLGLHLLVDILGTGVNRHTATQQGRRHQQLVAVTLENTTDNGIHGKDME